ncbi:MAG: hemerythrin domain-containing protein [Burkholderiales bacterium]|nr:hemerythrin domain-containing protein [Burkholderiales bacterium]MDE2396746.1 hemerythrin domain-containing protein [Burkholderiales bacterium]MDE2454126.1 hemerythrin domain-containing protein [Burkholderiales bacterium]
MTVIEHPKHQCADRASQAASPPPAAPSPRDWRGAGNAALVEYIIANYHDRLRGQLPELVRLARKVETRHGDRPDCPSGLADHLDATHQELEGHLLKEERILFPMLVHAGASAAQGPISMMKFEHEQHLEAVRRIDELTRDGVPPADACNSWRTLYAGLVQLRQDLGEHIRLENDFLFSGLAAASPQA